MAHHRAYRTRRYAAGADIEDATDDALGSADIPFEDIDYLVGWLRASPEEVSGDEFVRTLIGQLDQDPESAGMGAGLLRILAELLRRPKEQRPSANLTGPVGEQGERHPTTNPERGTRYWRVDNLEWWLGLGKFLSAQSPDPNATRSCGADEPGSKILSCGNRP